MPSRSRPASGAQHTIRRAGYEATIAAVGASLRSLRFAGRDLVLPFDADEVRPAYRGATLAPWPNRVVDGAFVFDGESHQLPLTEPGRGHALHGLAAWLAFELVETDEDRVTLEAVIEPQAGYPWRIALETSYALDENGLTQTVRALNLSARPAPFGTGPHPYLVAGEGTVDDWSLLLPAERVLSVTPDRLVPLSLEELGEFDFQRLRRIGSTEIDHAFTVLARDEHGSAVVRVTDEAGRGVAMSWNPSSCPWVQIHTADSPDGADANGHRAGLAVEPMSCAPDAFNDGGYAFDTGLARLDPGASFEADWRIFALPAD